MADRPDPSAPSGLSASAGQYPDVWPYNSLLPARRGLLVVLSGPSGVGKDAVLASLRASGLAFTKIVTVTTRAPRPTEIPGRDYYFLTRDEFEHWRQGDRFLEWANVYGTPYGTPAAAVQEALARGETVLLKIDVQGAAQVKRKAPNAVFIYLGPGSFDELRHRLTRRGTETEAEYQRRVQQAHDELEQVPLYDYLVVNRQGDLAAAVDQVRAIIVAERVRVQPREILIR
jgi:guanylate kinase